MLVRSTLTLAAVVALAAIIAGPLMEPTMEARLLRLRLQNFYEKHAPTQVDKVEGLVEKYVGNEAPLVRKLVDKYGEGLEHANIWALNDPVGVGAYVAYKAAAKRASIAVGMFDNKFPDVRKSLGAAAQAAHDQRTRLQSFVSNPAQLIFLACAYLMASCRLTGVPRAGLLIAVGGTAMIVVNPAVEEVSPDALAAGARELVEVASSAWDTLDTLQRAAAATGAWLLLGLTALRERQAFVACAWVLSVLAITNPPLPPGVSTLDAVKALGVADSKAVSFFQHSDEGLFAVHDLSFYSALTLSATAGSPDTSAWSAPMLAVGVADRWFVLSTVHATKTDETRVRIELPGVSFPLFFGPMVMGLLFLVQALVSGL